MTKPGRPRVLELARIRTDGDTQARRSLDRQAVADYAEAIERGEKLPPIVVFDDGRELWLADGFHRVAAMQQAKKLRISAQVMYGDRDKAAWYALGANRTNGLRMTNADKEHAVKRALRMRPDASDRSIAEHVGVSAPTVGKYRATVEPGVKDLHVERARTGRDGKQYPVDDPPPSVDDPPPSPTDEPPPCADEPPPCGDEPPPCPPPDDPPPTPDDDPPPSAAPVGVTDRLGRLVTHAGLAEALRRDQELVELCTALSRIKTAVLERIQRDDPLYADITSTAFEVDCNNARGALTNARPYTVCPYCGGDGCKACHRRGWVNKVTYEMAPAELRKTTE